MIYYIFSYWQSFNEFVDAQKLCNILIKKMRSLGGGSFGDKIDFFICFVYIKLKTEHCSLLVASVNKKFQKLVIVFRSSSHAIEMPHFEQILHRLLI